MTYKELTDFMERAGITWYGLSIIFEFAEPTVYRWSDKLKQGVVTLDNELETPPITKRMIHLEIRLLDALDRKTGFYAKLAKTNSRLRAGVIRKALDRLLEELPGRI